MAESKESSGEALQFAVPRPAIEAQIEDWFSRVFHSKNELETALKRLHASYCALKAGNPAMDDDKVLALVKSALKNADRTRSIV
jgi:hypothetical protein